MENARSALFSFQLSPLTRPAGNFGIGNSREPTCRNVALIRKSLNSAPPGALDYAPLGADRGLSPLCRSENRSPSVRNRGVQSGRERAKCWRWAAPAQLVNIVEEFDIGPERSKGAEKQCSVSLAGESFREATCVGHVYVPVSPVCRNRFEMDEL
jgi:hypothetical protein